MWHVDKMGENVRLCLLRDGDRVPKEDVDAETEPEEGALPLGGGGVVGSRGLRVSGCRVSGW